MTYWLFFFQGRCYSDILQEEEDEKLRQTKSNAMQKKRERLARLKEERLSREIIEKTTRPCPNCKMDISKMSGYVLLEVWYIIIFNSVYCINWHYLYQLVLYKV